MDFMIALFDFMLILGIALLIIATLTAQIHKDDISPEFKRTVGGAILVSIALVVISTAGIITIMVE